MTTRAEFFREINQMCPASAEIRLQATTNPEPRLQMAEYGMKYDKETNVLTISIPVEDNWMLKMEDD